MLLVEGVMGGQETSAVVFILVKLVTHAQKGNVDNMHMTTSVN